MSAQNRAQGDEGHTRCIGIGDGELSQPVQQNGAICRTGARIYCRGVSK